MIDFKEWRAKNEATALPVTMEPESPTAEDWHYYKTRIQGRAKFLLDKFIDEVSKKDFPLVRKGFIVQEVLDALGMDISQFLRIMNNIKRSLADHQRDERINKTTPSTPTTPTPSPVTPPGKPAGKGPTFLAKP